MSKKKININEKYCIQSFILMAGNADKKLAKTAQKQSKYIYIAMAALLLLQAYGFRKMDSWVVWDYIGQLILLGVCYWSATWMHSSIRGGFPIDYPLDLFGINSIVQIGSTFHSNLWWYVYLLVPIFFVYKIAKLLSTYCSGMFGSSSDGPAEKSKRQIKKEKLQEKMGNVKIL